MTTKQDLITLLRAFVNRRPGLSFANYSDLRAYRQESRRIQHQRQIALELLRIVEWDNRCTLDLLLAALDHGRLIFDANKRSLTYHAGQYEPVEYRPAVSGVCLDVIFDALRIDHPYRVSQAVHALIKNQASARTYYWAVNA